MGASASIWGLRGLLGPVARRAAALSHAELSSGGGEKKRNPVNETLYLGVLEYLVDNILTIFYNAIAIKLQGNDGTYKQTKEGLSYQEYKSILKLIFLYSPEESLAASLDVKEKEEGSRWMVCHFSYFFLLSL